MSKLVKKAIRYERPTLVIEIYVDNKVRESLRSLDSFRLFLKSESCDGFRPFMQNATGAAV